MRLRSCTAVALLMMLLASLAHAEALLPPDARYPKDPDAAGDLVVNGKVNGVAYQFYRSDASGVFQGTPDEATFEGLWPLQAKHWSVWCRRDSMTDRVNCFLQRGVFWLLVDAKGRTKVSIGKDHFPGTTVSLRIDEGKARTATAAKDGTFDEKTSAQIVLELKKARRLRTRYVEWPNSAPKDAEYLAYGFAEAFDFVVWAARTAQGRK